MDWDSPVAGPWMAIVRQFGRMMQASDGPGQPGCRSACNVAPLPASRCHRRHWGRRLREPSAMKIATVGLDLAKNVFQLHGVDAAGRVVVRRRLRRSEVIKAFTGTPPCLVGMEACAGAHHWEIGRAHV